MGIDMDFDRARASMCLPECKLALTVFKARNIRVIMTFFSGSLRPHRRARSDSDAACQEDWSAAAVVPEIILFLDGPVPSGCRTRKVCAQNCTHPTSVDQCCESLVDCSAVITSSRICTGLISFFKV